MAQKQKDDQTFGARDGNLLPYSFHDIEQPNFFIRAILTAALKQKSVCSSKLN